MVFNLHEGIKDANKIPQFFLSREIRSGPFLLPTVPWCSWFWKPVWCRCCIFFFFFFCIVNLYMCARVCYDNVLCGTLFHNLLWIILKDSSRLVVRAESKEEVAPLNKKQTCRGLKWGCDCGQREWKSGPWNLRWKLKDERNGLWSCFLQNWLHSVMDMQRYDTMESQRTELLYTIYFFF